MTKTRDDKNEGGQKRERTNMRDEKKREKSNTRDDKNERWKKRERTNMREDKYERGQI